MSALRSAYVSSIALDTGGVKEATPFAVTFDDIMERNMGWDKSPEHYRESADRQAKLAQQTKRIVALLLTQGIDVRQDADEVTALGEVTGETDTLDSYRSVCFLPVIAQRERKPTLNALRYFHKHNKLGKYLRYAVVTSGKRVPVHGDARGAMQDLSRRISKWASEASDQFGISVIFRAIEFTIDDDLTLHVHANVLYAPRKRLKGERWSGFLSWSHERFGSHWKDNGTLDKPEEALKYPFKPLDLEKLDAKALAWLYRETRLLKIVQPMGEFKDWRWSLENEVKTSEVIDAETGEVTYTEEKVAREKKYKIGFIRTRNGSQLVKIEKQKRKAPSETPPDNRELSSENMIVCRTAPQHRFGPYAESVTLVQNYTANPMTHEGKMRLAEIKKRQAEARKFWDANGAPTPEIALALGKGQRAAAEGEARKVRPFNVHTSRSTVRRKDTDRHPNSYSGPPRENIDHSQECSRECKTGNFEKTKENSASGSSSCA